MQGINFIAIDFETATGKRASICEAGICVVRNGEIVETRSWLVRPQGNRYSYWNMQIHGIRPNDTVDSPEFPWNYTAWRSLTSLIIVPSVRHAGYTTSAATVWTIFVTSSGYLTASTTGQATMRRCARGCS